MNQVYVCGSYYHIYISILRAIFHQNPERKSLIIIHDHIPHLHEIIPFLIEGNFFDFHLAVPLTSINRTKTNKLLRALKRKSLLTERVDSETDILKFEEFIRTAEINIFNNRGGAYNYFVQKFSGSYIRLIEDGLGNYQSLIGKFKIFRREYIFNLVIGAGHDDAVKEILVQFPEKVVEPLRQKAKKLELQKMQDSLSASDRERILKIFLHDYSIAVGGEKNLILITQPFQYLDAAAKIRMYNDVLDLYDGQYNIFIKPHPRDETEYTGKIKYAFTEIPRHFPLEMMNLLQDIQFDLGVTLYSGALHNITGVKERIFLGKGFLDKYR